MNDKNLHIDNLNNQNDSLFSKGKIEWEKSETEVWAELEKSISEKPQTKLVSFIPKIGQWAAAAVLILLVGLLGVVSTYTTTVECMPGEHIVAELPDGSRVDLNAGSKLEYYPLKWRLVRELEFEGEGYFNVEKGKRFTVKSPNGSTQVLGTSFNIYARDDKYRVTCLTGKVKVSSNSDESVIIMPNVHVELEEGKLVVKEMFKAEKTLSWRNEQFFFVGRPLEEVIDEIERQYAVTIKLQPELNKRNFGSNFSKKHSVEDVLEFVCKTMNVRFVKQSENVYLIVEES